MDSLVADLRYALRVLHRNRGFALAAVLTLALGIGANAAIFTVVNAVLLRPLPFGEPDRVMMVWLDNRRESIDRDVTSFPTFTDWETRSREFDGMAAYSSRRYSLTSEGGEPEEVRVTRATWDFFEVLDAPMRMGRGFVPEEDIPGNEGVVVVSHGLWQRRFGSDPQLTGRTIRLAGEPHVVIGVTRPGFTYPDETELWVPLAPDSSTRARRGALWLSVIGRLRPGTTVEAAQAEMSGIALQLEQEYEQNRNHGVRLEPLHETVVGPVRPALLVLLGAVAFVLLIACANVANLLLARGAARRREVSVRLAVGAGGARLARQMLTESVVLAFIGGMVGLGLAAFGVRALAALAPPGVPRLDGIAVDRTVTAYTFLVAVVTGLLFGLAPALQAARASVSTALRDEERGAAGRVGRVRPILVMAQVALALVLLTGAGLMLRTFQALGDIDPGFDATATLAVSVSPPAARYRETAQVLDFYDRFMGSLAALPGVRNVGAISTLFLSRLPNMSSIAVEGAPPRAPDDPVVAVVFDAVTPSFFETFGLRLIAGRIPNETETTQTPSVAVVNQSFVRQFMSEGDVVGRRFTYDNPENPDADWITVIGVIADARRAGPTEPIRPEAYIPHRQFIARSMTLLLRTDRDPLNLVPAVRGVLRALDAELPLSQVATVEQLVARAQSTRRFVLDMLLLFAGLAAVLAGVGIYGVMAYLVSRRTHEVGIRMAVGASRSDVIAMILRDAALQIGPGVLAGIAGAILLARLLRNQLYGVSPADPLTLAVVAILLSAVALFASWLPARRAATTDPLQALRAE